MRESLDGQRIVVSGASGFIGSALVPELRARGAAVVRLVRRPARGGDEIAWSPTRNEIETEKLDGATAIVNLAGDNISQRWTTTVKRTIRDSRVGGTTLLASAISKLSARPRVLISGSAVGIYGSRGNEELDETSALGNDFLAGVCKEWEAAANQVARDGVRVVNVRTGIVLGARGGMLAKVLPIFRMGLGGRLGDGKQWMSWISIADAVAALASFVTRTDMSGPVNLVAPNPVTNAEFSRELGAALHRPAAARVPPFALRLAMGDAADGAVLASQRVHPRRLLAGRFEFAHPTVGEALRAALDG